MAKAQLDVQQSEIQLEMARVAEKYKNLGYSIYYNHQRQNQRFDLYAVNTEKKDKIIFEFKHYLDYNRQKLFQLTEQVAFYKTKFPDCRVVAVFVRKLPKLQFEPGNFRYLLLRHLAENYQSEFRQNISGFVSLDTITDIEITSINFNDLSSIKISGVANVSFKSIVEESDVSGIVLNDGVPFFFNVILSTFSNFIDGLRHVIQEEAAITFDFSEFLGGLQ